MSLSKDDLDKVARLSHLNLADADKEVYLAQLKSILETMKSLDKLDLTQCEATTSVIDQDQVLRQDKVIDYGDLYLAKNAPKWDDHCFEVPKILKS